MVGKVSAPVAKTRARQVLSSVNTGPDSIVPSDQVAAVEGSDGGSSTGIEFSSREDVERLLGEKMKGKNRNDFKVICFGPFCGFFYLLIGAFRIIFQLVFR